MWSTEPLQVFGSRTRPGVAILEGRRCVYLDSNAWIHLTEREPAALEACLQAVAAGVALFPLSDASISEVIDQPRADQRLAVAKRMDELSLGVTYRAIEVVEASEAACAFDVFLGETAVPIVPRSTLFTWVGEYLGNMTLSYPDGVDRAEAERTAASLAERPELRSVEWLVTTAPIEQLRVAHATSKQKYVEKLTASVARGVAHTKGLQKRERKRALLREERLWALRNTLLPHFKRVIAARIGLEKVPEEMARIVARVGVGSEDRLRTVLFAAPSLELLCEIMAERTSNAARHVRPQDYHDVEHALAGAVYSDIFVTSDGNLFDLLSRRCEVLTGRRCRFVRGVRDLESHLARE